MYDQTVKIFEAGQFTCYVSFDYEEELYNGRVKHYERLLGVVMARTESELYDTFYSFLHAFSRQPELVHFCSSGEEDTKGATVLFDHASETCSKYAEKKVRTPAAV